MKKELLEKTIEALKEAHSFVQLCERYSRSPSIREEAKRVQGVVDKSLEALMALEGSGGSNET